MSPEIRGADIDVYELTNIDQAIIKPNCIRINGVDVFTHSEHMMPHAGTPAASNAQLDRSASGAVQKRLLGCIHRQPEGWTHVIAGKTENAG